MAHILKICAYSLHVDKEEIHVVTSTISSTFPAFFGPVTTNSSGKIKRNVTVVYFQNGKFETVAMVTNTYTKIKDINWPSGMLPRDSPECGWAGDQCSKDGKIFVFTRLSLDEAFN